jgi:adenylate cyclase
MSQTRQLAAIMFTDIVGYTALMGDDEQKALKFYARTGNFKNSIIVFKTY